MPSAGQINGLGLLNETTIILGNSPAAEFVRATISAIFVQGGYLAIDSMKLPQSVDSQQFMEVIDTINQGLRQSGNRIHSVSDLERVFELYDGPRLSFPDEAANDFTSVSATGDNGLSSNNGINSEAYLGVRSSMANGAADEIASVNCYRARANYPHQSSTDRTNITGKASINCSYVRGPPQEITYFAEVYLQQPVEFWGFVFWVRVGTPDDESKTGDPISFAQHELVAVTACADGFYRTMFELEVFGSLTGWFMARRSNYLTRTRYQSSRMVWVEC